MKNTQICLMANKVKMSVLNTDLLFEFLAYCENYSVSFRTEEESFWLHFTATI